MRPTGESYGISICGSTPRPRPLPAKTVLYSSNTKIHHGFLASVLNSSRIGGMLAAVNIRWIIIAPAKLIHCLKSAHICASWGDAKPYHLVLGFSNWGKSSSLGWIPVLLFQVAYTIATLSACLLPYAQIPLFDLFVVQYKFAIAFLFYPFLVGHLSAYFLDLLR